MENATPKSDTPKTLIEAVRHFSDIDTCNALMVEMKWPDGKITCPKCGCDRVGEIKTRRMLACKNSACRKQFSYKVGTIFEDSPLGLDKWFVAVWSLANCKNGVSSCEIARALGITQKSAWHMLHRIRLAMKTGDFMARGHVECDETFIGGLSKNMHASKRAARPKGRGWVGKIIVAGILERGGRVMASVATNQKRKTLDTFVRENVTPGANLYTDSLRSYNALGNQYAHEMIDHAVAYVLGHVHTNGIENFWSLLKRMLKGTYISVIGKHVEKYLDEECFRFNERKGDDGDRFLEVMRGVVGRRLTYKYLIAE